MLVLNNWIVRSLILAVFFLTSTTTPADEKPNIVLIMADDLGWGDPGFNGNKTIQTPHLDALARSGVVFDRFYSAAPVCSPTRGSCLTGRHPCRYGITGANKGHLPKQEITIAEYLKKAGYRTGHFGKWHLGTLTKSVVESNRGGPRGAKHYSPPQQHGFDVCFSTEAKVPTFDPMWRPTIAKSDRASGNTWWYPVVDQAKRKPYGTHYWNEFGKMIETNLDGDDSRVVMDRAIDFIELKGNKPFFAVVWFHSPHLPVVAAEKYTDLYQHASGHHKNYLGCVTAMDVQIGRLIDALKARKKFANTVIAFCSDNGPEGKDGAPGSAGELRGRKRSLHDGGIRVPGIISWPSQIKPCRTGFPAVTSDYLPTILDILNISPADDRPVDGVSLRKVLRGEVQLRERPICFQHGRQRAMIYDKMKIYSADNGKSFSLFDADDMAEKNDLSSSMQDKAKQMKRIFKLWQDSCSTSASGIDYRISK